MDILFDSWQKQYDDSKYPRQLYFDSIERIAATSSPEDMGDAIIAMLHWKDGKVVQDPSGKYTYNKEEKVRQWIISELKRTYKYPASIPSFHPSMLPSSIENYRYLDITHNREFKLSIDGNDKTGVSLWEGYEYVEHSPDHLCGCWLMEKLRPGIMLPVKNSRCPYIKYAFAFQRGVNNVNYRIGSNMYN